MNRLAALLALLLWLGGCAVQPLQRDARQWLERGQQLQQAPTWSLAGRISVRTADDALNGSLNWTQDGSRTDLSVRGPVGVGGFRLSGEASAMTYEDSRGERVLLQQPEAALSAQLGWDVPLASLAYWVRALPDPSMPVEQEFGPDGLLRTLRQLGWQVEFDRYGLSGALAMPGRVTILKQDLRIRLAVDRWQVPASP